MDDYVYNSYMPDYSIIEKMTKKEMITHMYCLESALQASIKENDILTDLVYHYDKIHRAHERLLGANNGFELHERSLVQHRDQVNSAHMKDIKGGTDDSKEEHNG